MQLQLQTFTSLVQNMAAAVQSAATQLLDLTIGSTLRAVLEANASIALWMQWLILQVLQTTRAATSHGADLDSWMADFSLTRLAAVPATGLVSFSRLTPTQSAFIPTGAQVRTADGTQTFSVIANTASTAFSGNPSGYTLPAGLAMIDLPVQAQVSGKSGNVQAGTITLLATAIPGIDTVTNPHAFQNGLDQETDNAFRGRFTNFFDTRSRATPLAIAYAISQVQQGLQYTIQENTNSTNAPQTGNFLVTIDDGSGTPSSALLSAVATAVDAMRPVGSIFSVQPPTILTANITLAINVSSDKSRATATVQAAITGFINNLPIGATLPLTKIAQLAYQAEATITNVHQVQINGLTADLTAPISGVIKPGTVIVT